MATTSDALYIGLISGTSADAIDAVLVDFEGATPHLLGQRAHPIPADIKTELYQLMVPGDNEIDRLGVLDQTLGELFAEAALQLLTDSGISPQAIQAIGSHGQTLRHRPAGQLSRAFTLQIADPNVIAATTGVTTVADFRRRDMAVGGQGAPLVPAFHRSLFGSPTEDRFIVNIGGIGNITYLAANGDTLGFDTGPGNGLMDSWIQRQQGDAYDHNGDWARSGKVVQPLLDQLLTHPYFAAPPPKSTGREMFTLEWLMNQLPDPAPTAADVQATLLELTARTLSQAIRQLQQTNPSVYICGGGAHNQCLLERLSECLQTPVRVTTALGLDPDWVEGAAFAWLAKQTLAGQPGNLPAVTGARRSVVLGGIYPA